MEDGRTQDDNAVKRTAAQQQKYENMNSGSKNRNEGCGHNPCNKKPMNGGSARKFNKPGAY